MEAQPISSEEAYEKVMDYIDGPERDEETGEYFEDVDLLELYSQIRRSTKGQEDKINDINKRLDDIAGKLDRSKKVVFI